MRKITAKRIFTLITMLALVLTTVFSTPLVVSAEETIGNFTALPDDESERSITMWKYAIPNMSYAGDRGDGAYVPDLAFPPLPGVIFEIVRVIPKEGAALVCPIRNANSWTVDATFPVQTVITGANGSAVLNLGTPSEPAIDGAGTSDGIYLIREVGTNSNAEAGAVFPEDMTITRAVADFFVHVPMTIRNGEGAQTGWLYDISVQPKNVLVDPLNPEKHILEGNGEDAHYYNSFLAGQQFYWSLTSNIPRDLVYVAPEDGYMTRATIVGPYYEETIAVYEGQLLAAQLFEISDNLDPNLNFHGYTIEVYYDGDWTALPAEHYTFTAEDNELRFSINESGMFYLYDGGFTQIRVMLAVSVDNNFNGVITNTFDVRYVGPNWTPGYEHTETSNEAFYFTGGYNINKVSAATQAGLGGAVFHIATSLANANEGIFLTTTGAELPFETAYYPVEDDEEPVPVVFISAETAADGSASFNGLFIHEVTLPQGSAPDAAYIASLHRYFYLVETTAPTGYELLRAPWQIRVTTSTHELEGEYVTTIPNDPATDLPFTGGAGTIGLVAIALSVISLGALALVLEKKLKRQDIA